MRGNCALKLGEDCCVRGQVREKNLVGGEIAGESRGKVPTEIGNVGQRELGGGGGHWREEEMPRRKMVFHPGEFYHVYNRGCGRQRIFFSPKNYRFFLGRLMEVMEEECVDLIAWCLMPNHYHLLVRPQGEGLSSAVQRLGLSYSKAINSQRERSGTLFEGPFQAVHVDCEEYLLYLSRYVHRNPVEAGLAGACWEWEFSSYRSYLDRAADSFERKEVILAEFGTVEEYKRFVESEREQGMGKISHLLIDV